VSLAERLLDLHRALARHHIPHAFGGAIALAYSTRNPRGTDDIDVNVFVAVEDCERALRALPAEIEQPDGTAARIRRDGQIRLWWDRTPVDLFFDYESVHADAARHRRIVGFEGARIPILAPLELAVFKAMFDRSQDWVDIEEMVAAQALDIDAVRAVLHTLLGADDPRFARLDDAVEKGTRAADSP